MVWSVDDGPLRVAWRDEAGQRAPANGGDEGGRARGGRAGSGEVWSIVVNNSPESTTPSPSDALEGANERRRRRRVGPGAVGNSVEVCSVVVNYSCKASTPP